MCKFAQLYACHELFLKFTQEGGVRVKHTTLQVEKYLQYRGRGRVMVFYATFNNISVISWRSVLLVEEPRVSKENHRPVASHWQPFSYNIVSSTPCVSGIRTHNVTGDRHWLFSQLSNISPFHLLQNLHDHLYLYEDDCCYALVSY